MSFSLDERVQILHAIGDFINSEDVQWLASKKRAAVANPWFTEEMINTMSGHIQSAYTDRNALELAIEKYNISEQGKFRSLGIINAGNIPLVGFHDFLAAFLVGIPTQIKLSSKDKILFESIFKFAEKHFPGFDEVVTAVERLEDCDAYIATGGETSSMYFEKYFGQKPNIIRGHRNSIAILEGNENEEQLAGLADDIHLYFGLGCRSVTHVFVPEGYDFQSMLESFSKYEHFQEHTKYMNNYDYQLAIYIINGDQYMARYSTLLVENPALSSAVSVVHYSYYTDRIQLLGGLNREKLQCIVGSGETDFGQSQYPRIFDFADGEDTFEFCRKL